MLVPHSRYPVTEVPYSEVGPDYLSCGGLGVAPPPRDTEEEWLAEVEVLQAVSEKWVGRDGAPRWGKKVRGRKSSQSGDELGQA